jgi:hypothetical protein
VTLPDKLTIGWHGPVLTPELPLAQTAAPQPLDLGTIAPGTSMTGTYTIQVKGDGTFDLDALVLGSDNNATVHGFGRLNFKPDSQLLFYKGTLGAKVRSQANPSLIQAGTPFLVNVHLENRSYYKRLVLDPIYATPGGNAQGGVMLEQNVPVGSFKPNGNLQEVFSSPYIVLKPRQSRDFYTVIRTQGSDPFADASSRGGTRAEVTFDPPTVRTVADDNKTAAVAADHVVIADGSQAFHVGIDDSQPPQPPVTFFNVIWSVGAGVLYGIYDNTWGAVTGLFGLARSAVSSVLNVPISTLNEIDHLVELWTATEDDPAARAAFVQALQAKVLDAFKEAPFLIPDTLANLGRSIDQSSAAYFAKLSKDWYAGDWRNSLTDVARAGTNVVFLLAPGTLARVPAVAKRWEVLKAATYAKAGEKLVPLHRALVRAREGLAALKEVKAGYLYKVVEMRNLFGVSAKEHAYLAKFAAGGNRLRKKVSVVLRSRAKESIKWLEEGAELKPFWIKTKNVSWADVEYLGYESRDVGRIVMKDPPPFTIVKDRLRRAGVKEGSPEFEAVRERWQIRVDERRGEWHDMQRWNEAGGVKGKWPWGDNAINPNLQADQVSTYRFQLVDRRTGHRVTHPRPGGEYVPEIFNHKTGKWASITGDVDLIALTNADGSALTEAEHVALLKELRGSPLGTQHPESVTWTKRGKFWFDGKRNYLVNEDLAQFGPDGGVRKVVFDEALSNPTQWTPSSYRIFWQGGYQVGPGQVRG